MDHYAPTHDLREPWRTRTLIVSAIAGVELLALVGLGAVLLGRGWFEHARTSAAHRSTPAHAAKATRTTTATPPAKPKPAKAAPARSIVARAQTGLLVLNGNGVAGAAGAEAQALRAHGYPVLSVGNAKRNDYAASIIMYRPGYGREARRLARDAGISIVAVLDGLSLGQLHGAKLAIILGR